MSPKMNSIFQIGRNRAAEQKVKREELMDRLLENCFSIQTYINSMDSQLDQYFAQARRAQTSNNQRELSFAYQNIRTALTQKKVAQIMCENLKQIRNQVQLNTLIESFSCDVSAMAELCRNLNGNLNIKKVMRDYNEIMKPLGSASLQFDYFNEQLINSMASDPSTNMGISDEEIAAMINHSDSDSWQPQHSFTTSSYPGPGPDTKQKSKTTDSLRERLNRF
ncbi:MAG: hypothetical protein SO016_03500 [Lachnospiraceae bacterium]|nr:hypothetical protein [Robinsoniella sp.]MDY3765751.1 hypothetical protein [Lachnospiraceae bacterium]